MLGCILKDNDWNVEIHSPIKRLIPNEYFKNKIKQIKYYFATPFSSRLYLETSTHESFTFLAVHLIRAGILRIKILLKTNSLGKLVKFSLDSKIGRSDFIIQNNCYSDAEKKPKKRAHWTELQIF